MATIRYIENPPFIVDFRAFIDAKKIVALSFSQKVQNIVFQPFKLVGFIFISVTQSAGSTLRYSWISFKYIVLGYYGSLSDYRLPEDFYLVMFKAMFWALAVFWCFATTALRLLIEQIDPPSKAMLSTYTEGKIDALHLRTKELSIDVSGIPSDTTIDTLMTFYRGINFTDRAKPAYMGSSSRTNDEGKLLTVEELRNGLETFIKHIKGRVAFLGTPPAFDTPRLMTFYQQIEDAVRFSIHKINQDFEKFLAENGSDPAKYEEAQMRQYKDLLEARSRTALDMAMAGGYCGARYMAQTLSTYFRLKGESQDNGTLEESLIELLAYKRNEVAQKQVGEHFGGNVHALSKYMAALGEPLGLPGTANVIEHLRQNFNYDKYLKSFFEDYTVDFIIDAVQEKIKKSQSFREKITDWIQDQIGDWKKESENVQKWIEKIQLIIDEEVEGNLPSESQQFKELIAYLRQEGVDWPVKNEEDEVREWDDFFEELISLPQAKNWFKLHFKNASVLELQQKKAQIKQKFRENVLGSDTAQKIKKAIIAGEPLPLESTSENERKQQKIDKIQQILLIQKDTLSRVLDGKTTLESAIKDHFDIVHRGEFLPALGLTTMPDGGVSPAILEWLLVSHQILLPQEVE